MSPSALLDEAFLMQTAGDISAKSGNGDDRRVKLTVEVPDEWGNGKMLFSTIAINRAFKRINMFFFPVRGNGIWTVRCRCLVDFVYPDTE